MRHALLVLLALLALAAAMSAAPEPAQAGGTVTVCDEPHLLAALAGGGNVTFACSGTITLTQTITIASDTTIDGSGQSVTISGNDAVGILQVNVGAALDLNRVTLTNGRTNSDGKYDGGAIRNDGTVRVIDSTISGNTAGCGGGIWNHGVLTVDRSTVSGNSTSTSCGGGGIYNYYTSATATVNDSIFRDNSTSGSGGAIRNDGGTAIVSNCTFGDNRAAPTGGGGGGALNLYDGTLAVRNCTFDRNSAGGDGYMGSGGAIFVGRGELTVGNSTFFDNIASSGGGIYTSEGTVTVTNSTFFGDGNIIWRSAYGSATIRNTIAARSTGGTYNPNCVGVTDGGGNLTYGGFGCPGIDADPKLGRLKDNGSPTWTMALLPGSAAIDAAVDANCTAEPVNSLDQRGVVRPQGAHCDIGAFEALQPGAHVYLPVVLR